MLDLKNCPFCGSSGEELMLFCDPDEGRDNSGPSRRIQCAVCNVEAPFYPSEAEAITAWNRRAIQAVGPVTTVAVRPLEWVRRPHQSLSRAETDLGVYRAWTHFEAGGRWFWSLDGYQKVSGEVSDEDEAKAAAQADHDKRISSRIRSALVATPPAEQHPDEIAVDRFAEAMKAKLKWEREQRNRSGWQAMSAADLSRILYKHLPKGDPVDVANLSMMLHQNGQQIETPPAEPVVDTDWINYRPLAEGEIIQDGDECLTDSHLGWQPAANTVGSAAPDPSYTAHRMYRRPLAAKPAVKDDETVVEALIAIRDGLRSDGKIWLDKGNGGREAGPTLNDFIAAALAAKDGRS